MTYFRPKAKPRGVSDADFYLPAWGPRDFDPQGREPGSDDDADETDNIAWEFEPDLEVCREVEVCIAAITKNVQRKVDKMKVGAFVQEGGGEQLPFLDAKAVGKGCSGKILAARPVKTPKFHGLFLDVKVGNKKYSYGLAFDRYDLGAVVAQTGSEETDDWIGESIRFVTKKGKGKKVFVNVARPKGKGKK